MNPFSPLVATERTEMLCDPEATRLPEFDLNLYEQMVPRDHFLRKVLEAIPWNDLYEEMAPFYCRDRGRPSEDPVMMLKLEYLRYHYGFSDREVIARAETDLALRYFLRLPLRWNLPHPSSLCMFRGRLGGDGFAKVFTRVVGAAREHGVVRDRLRIKDASHVIGNVAVPTALALVAQTRDRLLTAAEPFAPLLVEGERINLDMLRQATQNRTPSERLATRVAQLEEMLAWADELDPPENAEQNRAWQKLVAQRDLAHKILEDQQHPERGDRTVSTTDPDVRCGKHGQWFDGYLVDISIDADSEIVTAINVLPAGGDEAADAVELIRQEEAAHGNDVKALSIDGVGFNGPVLRELQDPDGLNVDTYVPVPKESGSETKFFTPEDFKEDSKQEAVTCPAGQTSTSRYHDSKKQTTKHRFSAKVCNACALASECMKNPPKRHGRTVCKSDYQAEHERARHKVTTSQYQAVRREHPMVERKLGELLNRHGGRRARYRGIIKVLIQEMMGAVAMNIKRLVRLVYAPNQEICCQA